ncbi:hypothetical protein C8T65DRAFT_824946 [Cerioporus squamosus]|nr:hypothetical protein C8T65DRAFT_824946 [Cerioporus squamosus]
MPTLLLEQTVASTNTTAQEMADFAVKRIQEFGCHPMGFKLKLDDPSVMYLKVPDSHYSLRIWAASDQALLDHFDDRQLVAVQSTLRVPLARSLRSAHATTGMFFDDMREMAMPEGMDWFFVIEGSYLTLKRDGVPDYHIQIPALPRPPFAQFGRNPYASVVSRL